MTMTIKEVLHKGFLTEAFRLSTNPRRRRLRALSGSRFAALAEAGPGDTCLVIDNRAEKTARVKAVHADSAGKTVYQTDDGRVLSKNRLVGQLGAVCSVDTSPGPDEIDFAADPVGAHLDLPVAARLFGLKLSDTEAGYAATCPYCCTNTLEIWRHKGMWLFGCPCGKKGDVMDFVGWLAAGDDWQPEAMDYDQMADLVLPAIHERRS